MRFASKASLDVAPHKVARQRGHGWGVGLAIVLAVLAGGALVYVEAAPTPGERAFRARGCALCHGAAFFDDALPPLQSWKPGQALTPQVQAALDAAHPWLAEGEAELAAYVAQRQLPALAARHAQGTGERLFRAKCAACHGADGLGQPAAYPPLQGSEWLREPDKLARLPEILTQGLQGPITVKGEPWDAIMNAPGLKDAAEREAVTDYIRGRF